jgi:hypothetical protein
LDGCDEPLMAEPAINALISHVLTEESIAVPPRIDR